MLRIVGASLGILSTGQQLFVGLLTILRILNSTLDLVGLALVGLTSSIAFGIEETPSIFMGMGLDRSETLLVLLLSAAISFSLRTIFGISLSRLTMIYLARLETLYSLRIASSIFSSQLSSVEAKSPPEIDWLILRSTQKAFTGIVGHATNLVSYLFLAVFIVGFFLLSDWKLTIASVSYLSLVLIAFHVLSRNFVSRQGELFSTGSMRVARSLRDLQDAYKELLVLSRVDFFLRRLAEDRGMVAQAEAMHFYLSPIPRYLMELSLVVGACGLLSYQLIFQSAASDISTLAVFIAGSLRLASSLLPIQRSFQYIRYEGPQASAAVKAVQQSVPASSGGRNTSEFRRQNLSTKNHKAPESPVSVVFESVSFTYGGHHRGDYALQNLSFSIFPGELIAIVGPSGAGKSTLVDLLLGLRAPSEGYISCSGIAPSELAASRAGIIGYVPQRVGIVSGTILENIALGESNLDVDFSRVRESLEQAQLTEVIGALPHGLQTDVGKQISSLSGGEFQRLGLARALYFSPRLLVLDEPTSALDPRTEEAIMSSLVGLRSESTVVMTTHRLHTIERADRIFFIEDGALIGCGTFESLKVENDAFRAFIDFSLGSEKDL